MPLRETRRILLDGNVVDVVRQGDELLAGDGRTIAIDEAVHLPPTIPSKMYVGRQLAWAVTQAHGKWG